MKEFTTAKKGEVDGFTLSDGQWIHRPPHLSSRFADLVVKGDKVRVTGFKETGKKGETKLEVSTGFMAKKGRSFLNGFRERLLI